MQLEDGNGMGHYVWLKAVSIVFEVQKQCHLSCSLSWMELEILPDLRSKEGRGGGEGTGERRKEAEKEKILQFTYCFPGHLPTYPSRSPKGSNVFTLLQEGWGSKALHPAKSRKSNGSHTNLVTSSSYCSMLPCKELEAAWGRLILIQEQVWTSKSQKSYLKSSPGSIWKAAEKSERKWPD